MVIDTGHYLHLPQHPGHLVDQPDPFDDVDAPQLHRRRPLKPLVGAARPSPRPRLCQALAEQDPVHRPLGRRRHTLGQVGGSLRSSSSRIRFDPHRGCLRRISATAASTNGST